MENTTIPEKESWDQRMARERKEREENALAFSKKMEKAFTLCELELFGIDKDSEYPNDQRKATLKGSSKSAYLFASFSRYGHKGRIVIDLYYTGQLSARDVWGHEAQHESITVSDTKTSEQIASDIKNRILPKLADSITKADTLIASRNAYTDKTEKNVLELGGKRRDRNGDIDRTIHIDGGTVEVSGDNARFTLYGVDIETAKKIVKLLKTNKKGA